MASAEKLLQDAQFEFQNISHGSTNARKHMARARRVSQRIIRKYPTSMEASLARSMLQQLDVNAQLSVSRLLEPSKTLAEVHVHSARPVAQAADPDSWLALWQRLIGLPYLQKRILFFLLIFVGVFVSFTPFLLLVLVFYVTKPDRVKKHVRQLLDILHPAARANSPT